MYKLLFAFVMLVSLHAEDRIQILGTSAVYNTPKLATDGNPVIFYQDQILSADLLTYDQDKGFLQGQGNVHIFKGNEYHIISDYFTYDTQTNTRYSKPYFAFDQVTQMWMSTADAHSVNEDVLFIISFIVSFLDRISLFIFCKFYVYNDKNLIQY